MLLFIIFQSDMFSHLREELKIETEQRNAVENDELTLHYQPQFKIGSEEIVGLEALLR
ncbi:hypothetical protein [Litchfieldia alkalitelluris]|uniref:hypothetical protein n=1 Tax=Litchfieldia alkalitelluris TaxID=304268 RepID=UPI0014731658|nr:hypothetical protein [Litchfieldia alkalitelluris]